MCRPRFTTSSGIISPSGVRCTFGLNQQCQMSSRQFGVYSTSRVPCPQKRASIFKCVGERRPGWLWQVSRGLRKRSLPISSPIGSLDSRFCPHDSECTESPEMSAFGYFDSFWCATAIARVAIRFREECKAYRMAAFGVTIAHRRQPQVEVAFK